MNQTGKKRQSTNLRSPLLTTEQGRNLQTAILLVSCIHYVHAQREQRTKVLVKHKCYNQEEQLIWCCKNRDMSQKDISRRGTGEKPTIHRCYCRSPTNHQQLNRSQKTTNCVLPGLQLRFYPAQPGPAAASSCSPAHGGHLFYFYIYFCYYLPSSL